MFFCAFQRDKEEEKLIFRMDNMVCIQVYASIAAALGMMLLGDHRGFSVNRHSGSQCVGIQNLELSNIVQLKETVWTT